MSRVKPILESIKELDLYYRSNGLLPVVISIILLVFLTFPHKTATSAPLEVSVRKILSVAPPLLTHSCPKEEDGIISPVRLREGPNYKAINSLQRLSLLPYG